jgi:hypothetical protein
MVAPVPTQISNLPPRLRAAAHRRPLLTPPLPTTPSVPSVLRPQRSLCCAFFRLTPLLPITSLQPQQFHAITHSFAQRRAAIPFTFNGFRTLSIATGVYPSIIPDDTLSDFQRVNSFVYKSLAPLCRLFHSFLHSFPLFSIACSLFSENTRVGGNPSISRFRLTNSHPLLCVNSAPSAPLRYPSQSLLFAWWPGPRRAQSPATPGTA